MFYTNRRFRREDERKSTLWGSGGVQEWRKARRNCASSEAERIHTYGRILALSGRRSGGRTRIHPYQSSCNCLGGRLDRRDWRVLHALHVRRCVLPDKCWRKDSAQLAYVYSHLL